MPHTNKQALTKLVLDEAIAAVAEQEFNRLRRITNDDVQLAENINAALDSLAKLQYGVKPEYNEWDALFYLTWYQPRQINLALTILPGLYEDARTDLGANFSLHIIDVGYGALAIQFAMAILATEYQLEGKDVTVNGIDPSEPMKKIGEALWLEFWSILSGHPDLSDLSRVCDYITNNCGFFDSHTSYCCFDGGFSRVNPRPVCWIMAVHAIYESNKDKIKRALQALQGQYSPSVILVTAHESKRGIARYVTGEGFRFNKLDSAELKFHGELRETTEWRRCLVNRLRENPLNSVAGLLFSPVEWAPHNHKTTLCKILGGG